MPPITTFPIYRRFDEQFVINGGWFVQELQPTKNLYPDIHLMAENSHKDNYEDLGVVLGTKVVNASVLHIQCEKILPDSSSALVSCLTNVILTVSSLDISKFNDKNYAFRHGFQPKSNSTASEISDMLEPLHDFRESLQTSSSLLHLFRQRSKSLPGPTGYCSHKANTLWKKLAKDGILVRSRTNLEIAEKQDWAKEEKKIETLIETGNERAAIAVTINKEEYPLGYETEVDIDIFLCDSPPAGRKRRRLSDRYTQVLVRSYINHPLADARACILQPYNKDTQIPVPFKKFEELKKPNIRYWIVDGQHSINACKFIHSEEKYNADLKKKLSTRKAKLLCGTISTSAMLAIAESMNVSGRCSYKTPYIEEVRCAREDFYATLALGELREKAEEKLAIFFPNMKKGKDGSREFIDMDDETWNRWDQMITNYQEGLLDCSVVKAGSGAKDLEETNLNSLSANTFRELRGMTVSEMDKALDGINDGSIHFVTKTMKRDTMNMVYQFSKYCKRLKAARRTLCALVANAHDRDKTLDSTGNENEQIGQGQFLKKSKLTAENVLDYYEVSDDVFENWLDKILVESEKYTTAAHEVVLPNDVTNNFYGYITSKQKGNCLDETNQPGQIEIYDSPVETVIGALSRWKARNGITVTNISLYIIDMYSLARNMTEGMQQELVEWIVENGKSNFSVIYISDALQTGNFYRWFNKQYNSILVKTHSLQRKIGVFDMGSENQIVLCLTMLEYGENARLLPATLHHFKQADAILDRDPEFWRSILLVLGPEQTVGNRDDTQKNDELEQSSEDVNTQKNDEPEEFSEDVVMAFYCGKNIIKECHKLGLRCISFGSYEGCTNKTIIEEVKAEGIKGDIPNAKPMVNTMTYDMVPHINDQVTTASNDLEDQGKEKKPKKSHKKKVTTTSNDLKDQGKEKNPKKINKKKNQEEEGNITTIDGANATVGGTITMNLKEESNITTIGGANATVGGTATMKIIGGKKRKESEDPTPLTSPAKKSRNLKTSNLKEQINSNEVVMPDETIVVPNEVLIESAHILNQDTEDIELEKDGAMEHDLVPESHIFNEMMEKELGDNAHLLSPVLTETKVAKEQ